MFNALTGVFGGNKTNHHIDNDKKPERWLQTRAIEKNSYNPSDKYSQARL